MRDNILNCIKRISITTVIVMALFTYNIYAAERNIVSFEFDANDKVTGEKLTEYGSKDGYAATNGSGTLICYMDNQNSRALEWSDPEYSDNGKNVVPIIRASEKNMWGNTPAYVISFSSKGMYNLKFSAFLGGSSNGPGNFKLQYSIDGNNYSDIAASEVTIPLMSRKTMSAYYNKFSLPEAVENCSNVYLRIIAANTNTILGGSYLNTPMGGEMAINHIGIYGSDTKSQETVTTTTQQTTQEVTQQTTTKANEQTTTASSQQTTTNTTPTSAGNDNKQTTTAGNSGKETTSAGKTEKTESSANNSTVKNENNGNQATTTATGEGKIGSSNSETATISDSKEAGKSSEDKNSADELESMQAENDASKDKIDKDGKQKKESSKTNSGKGKKTTATQITTGSDNEKKSGIIVILLGVVLAGMIGAVVVGKKMSEKK